MITTLEVEHDVDLALKGVAQAKAATKRKAKPKKKTTKSAKSKEKLRLVGVDLTAKLKMAKSKPEKPKAKPKPKPTGQQYGEFEVAYDYFNKALFDEKLPGCLITFTRSRVFAGYFSANRWTDETRELSSDEISMNPQLFMGRPLVETLSTLVHEMVHLWQYAFASPGRGRYHNKECGDKMESLGLMPSNTGQADGKRTGDRMSHYIIDGGPYSRAATKLLGKGYAIPWLERQHEKSSSVAGKRIKYTCPDCGINAWGKSGLLISCVDCEVVMPPAVVHEGSGTDVLHTTNNEEGEGNE